MANERSGMDASSIDWSFSVSQACLPPRSPLFASAQGPLDNNSFFSLNWPKIPRPNLNGNGRHHQRTPSTSFLPQTPAWVDDLLNDAPDLIPPKNSHRRSSSDSLAFLEAPSQHVRTANIAEGEEGDSEKNQRMASRESKAIDTANEEWLSPKITGSESSQAIHKNGSARASSYENKTPFETCSTLSDRDSANASSFEDKKMKGVRQSKGDAEVQSALKVDHSPLTGAKVEPVVSAEATLDPKRAKRILANRQSAQRSRVRKLQYIVELERTVNVLQEEVSVLSPQVAYLDRHRVILNVDNSAMKQRIAALAQEKLFKDAHNEALKTEVHRLRQLYQQQQNSSQPGFVHDNSQLELKDLDVAKCVDFVFKESEFESQAAPRSPLLKAIGSSSCSTSEKGKGMLGLELHSDFRVQNS